MISMTQMMNVKFHYRLNFSIRPLKAATFISISGATTLEKSLSCCFGSFQIVKNIELIFQKKYLLNIYLSEQPKSLLLINP